MTDADCVAFLRWALPRLGLRWPGFRKVRRQVCKRVARRMAALGLAQVAAYRAYLEREPSEWAVLDGLCRSTISRFWRDRGVFEHLGARVLPELARRAGAAGRETLGAWSAGCASGEEPYSLKILWELGPGPHFPGLRLKVTASDADANLLRRARAGRYGGGSLEELPAAWREAAFAPEGELYRLRPRFRADIAFARQDIRRRMPKGPFDLILCRNLAFTYFDEAGQRRLARRLARRLRPGGVLVLGKHETVPEGCDEIVPSEPKLAVYRRGDEGEGRGRLT
ncbi:MAG: CheR family methyltransferase [Alphaproteobacteria bacterium]